MKKLILITGSEGLIGKTLYQMPLNDIEFIGLDNKHKKSHLDYGDTRNPLTLAQKIAQCDGIVHLAALSRVVWAEQDPTRAVQINVHGTQNVLAAIRQTPHKPWIIFGSSREVYGQQDILPVHENAPYRPLNTYAHTKVLGEKLIVAHQECGCRAAILRFSNVYGRTDDHSTRVIPAFCRAAVRGEPIFAEGMKHTFDFTHVMDVVSGILAVIRGLMAGQSYPPLHFTSGQATSLFELASLVKKLGNNNNPIFERPPRSYDVAHFIGDPTRAKELLHWQPQIALEKGLGRLINDFQKNVCPSSSYALTLGKPL